MTPLQQEPSAHAPCHRTMFGRVFISGIPSWWCLMAIVRREAAAGVSVALLHFADACCAAGARHYRSCRPEKSRVTSGSPRQAARGRPPARRDHPAAADDPALADRTRILLTGAPEGGWGVGGRPEAGAK